MTEVATLTLTEFLSARIAEDEADALALTRWEWSRTERHQIGPAYAAVCETSDAGEEVLPHIARWSPARVLAECEAKRRLMAGHTPDEWRGQTLCGRCSAAGHPLWPCETLRLLALPYADHPDFLADWRP